MKRRIGTGASASLLVLGVSIVAFGGSPDALATQDQAVIAGQTNTEEQTTVMRNTNFSVDCSLSFLGATESWAAEAPASRAGAARSV